MQSSKATKGNNAFADLLAPMPSSQISKPLNSINPSPLTTQNHPSHPHTISSQPHTKPRGISESARYKSDSTTNHSIPREISQSNDMFGWDTVILSMASVSDKKGDVFDLAFLESSSKPHKSEDCSTLIDIAKTSKSPKSLEKDSPILVHNPKSNNYSTSSDRPERISNEVESLMSMGFDKVASIEALQISNGDLDIALDVLTAHNKSEGKTEKSMASTFGSLAKSVFNNMSKRVLQTRGGMEVSEEDWNKTSFKDSSNSVPMPSMVKDAKKAVVANLLDPFESVQKGIVKEEIIPLDSINDDLRLRGNDFFKKGQYGEAEIQYTAAIDRLTAGSVLLIPLYNNRAACRLKNGDNRGVISDCNLVLIALPDDIKALQRRASAFEGVESWIEAREDYRRIMGIDSSVKGCSLALSRCQAAIEPSNIAIVNIPKPVAGSVKKAVDVAIKKLRDSNEAQELFEKEKFGLQEKVSRKIDVWKLNKESNVRALLASLDMILWKECGWKPVALSELITVAQVKVKYMRAVAKVHPDKLGVDCKTENLMIASLVFSILNKAWDSLNKDA